MRYSISCFSDAEFTADVPSTIVHCDRYIAGSFRRGNEQWPVIDCACCSRIRNSPGERMSRGQQRRRRAQASRLPRPC